MRLHGVALSQAQHNFTFTQLKKCWQQPVMAITLFVST